MRSSAIKFGLILALFVPSYAFGQATLVAHTAAQAANGSNAVTSPIDTSSCTTHCAEVVITTTSHIVIITPTDSNLNTWVPIFGTTTNSCFKIPGYNESCVWIAIAPTVSTTQTFTATDSLGPAIAVFAFNGIAGPDAASPAPSQCCSTGLSVTPTNNDEVLIALEGASWGGSGYATPSVSAGFTLADALAASSNTVHMSGAGSAYQIQTTKTAETAIWNGGTILGNGNEQFLVALYSTQAPGVLSVTTSSLPEAVEGTAYDFCLQATGGVQPYTWTQTAGNALSTYGLTLGSNGCITGTPSSTVSATPVTFQVEDADSSTASSSGLTLTVVSTALSIPTSTCASSTQYMSYSGCTIAATGGTGTYTFAWLTNSPSGSCGSNTFYCSLPEGMALNTGTGAITSALIGAQGVYNVNFQVTDTANATATKVIQFSVQGNDAFAQNIFPSNSIFHYGSIQSLPVDVSPAAPLASAYQASTVKAGNGDAIPMIEVPSNQTTVPIFTRTNTLWCYIGTAVNPLACQTATLNAPVPPYAPIEGTCTNSIPANGDDGHVLVYVEPGGGGNGSLFEMWISESANGACVAPGTQGWQDSSQGYWPDVTTNNLTPQCPSGGCGKPTYPPGGTADAAGLPIMPLLLTADEVCGTSSGCASANGTVHHVIRFTIPHMLTYSVWPATAQAGAGSCHDASGLIPTFSQVSQGSTAYGGFRLPTTCTANTPNGEIYRLKSSVTNPACASTSPQSAVIITALRNYGMIAADNGIGISLIVAPDPRWNSADLACLNHLTGSNFEPVDVHSLTVSNDSGQVGSTPSGPVISFTPSSAVQFGSITVNTSSPATTITVTNSGNANLIVNATPGSPSGVALGGTNANLFALSSDGCSGQTITPTSSCTLNVTFTPTSTGPFSANVTVTDTTDGVSGIAQLNGTGVSGTGRSSYFNGYVGLGATTR